ncbi:hypothetical protein [Hyphococcus lacteus]|uniref:Uncharacterized protein n=1 Tax=Hyphococcus lacteus TaxID=3143536 RepID=A0ABV3Z7K9_9PROT
MSVIIANIAFADYSLMGKIMAAGVPKHQGDFDHCYIRTVHRDRVIYHTTLTLNLTVSCESRLKT